MAAPTETISFRLPATFAKELRELATRVGDSPGEYARRLVTEALASKQREDIQEVRRLVELLRDDVATAVAVLLVKAGKAEPREAEEWVRKNLHV